MADQDPDKLWLQASLNQVAISRAADAIQQLGSALPCEVTAVSGSFVTVAFEVDTSPWTLSEITIPKAEGPWIRSPTQVGDYGLTIPASAFLNAVSGQGGGTPDMTRPGNLGALVWLPVASKAFSSVNVNAAYVSGPQGAVIQTEDGSAVMTLDSTGLTIKVGSLTWTFDSAGFTMSTGVVAETHVHSDPQGGDTGTPIA